MVTLYGDPVTLKDRSIIYDQNSYQHTLSCSHSLTFINCMFTSLIEHSDGLSLLFSTPMHPNSIRLGIETFPDQDRIQGGGGAVGVATPLLL